MDEKNSRDVICLFSSFFLGNAQDAVDDGAAEEEEEEKLTEEEKAEKAEKEKQKQLERALRRTKVCIRGEYAACITYNTLGVLTASRIVRPLFLINHGIFLIDR